MKAQLKTNDFMIYSERIPLVLRMVASFVVDVDGRADGRVVDTIVVDKTEH